MIEDSFYFSLNENFSEKYTYYTIDEMSIIQSIMRYQTSPTNGTSMIRFVIDFCLRDLFDSI